RNFEPIFANDGYRPNVGIIICNQHGQVFWARRIKRDGWQFPQGGVARDESLTDAMYRELEEETGLQKGQVRLVAHTRDWLKYDLPKKLLRNQKRRFFGGRRKKQISFRGQKQVWFLLELLEDDSVVNLKAGLERPEFDTWQWVEASFAIDNIVAFKRPVYERALSELGPYLPVTD
ncbi:MAG: RNA pyrophosphohydrolase, partial [Pseudomonadota bacterium]